MRICQTRLDMFLMEQKRVLRQLFHDADMAKLRAADLGEWISTISKSGLIDGQVCLGNKVLSLSYQPIEGGSDSGPCFQAALCIPEGMGAIRMDTQDWQAFQSKPEGLEANARAHFVPLLECRPVIQQWLLTQIDVLIEKLIALLPADMQPASTLSICPSISTQVCVYRQRAR